MNLIFDVDDTLYDMTQPFQRAYDRLWKGKYQVDVAALFRISREYSNAIFDKVVKKEITIDESGVYRIKMVMKDFGYEISEEEALEFQLNYRHFQSDIIMSEEIKQLLDYCVAHDITLGVLTNGVSDHQHKKIDGLHLQHWIKEEYLFVSDDIGYAKPEKQAFEFVEAKMKIDKEDTWYVGDSIEHDIHGAKGAGWHMIWLDRRGNQLKENDPTPDVIVKSEKELLAFVRQMNEE